MPKPSQTDPEHVPVIPCPVAQRALGLTDGRYAELIRDGVLHPVPIGAGNREGITIHEFKAAHGRVIEEEGAARAPSTGGRSRS